MTDRDNAHHAADIAFMAAADEIACDVAVHGTDVYSLSGFRCTPPVGEVAREVCQEVWAVATDVAVGGLTRFETWAGDAVQNIADTVDRVARSDRTKMTGIVALSLAATPMIVTGAFGKYAAEKARARLSQRR